MHAKNEESENATKSTWTTPVLMSTDIARETAFLPGPNGEANGRPDS